MADIIPLTRGFNGQVVTAIRELLARAEAGEILDGIWVLGVRGGAHEVTWTGCDDLVRLSGYVARIQHRIQLRLDGAKDSE